MKRLILILFLVSVCFSSQRSYICVVEADSRYQAMLFIPNGGWSRGCSENGEYPATYYFCNWVQPTPADFEEMEYLDIWVYEKIDETTGEVLLKHNPALRKIR